MICEMLGAFGWAVTGLVAMFLDRSPSSESHNLPRHSLTTTMELCPWLVFYCCPHFVSQKKKQALTRLANVNI